MMMMWIESVFRTAGVDGNPKYDCTLFKARGPGRTATDKKKYDVMVKHFIETCFLSPGTLKGSQRSGAGNGPDPATRFAMAVAKSSASQPWLLKATYDEETPPYSTKAVPQGASVTSSKAPVFHAWQQNGFLPRPTMELATKALRGQIKLPTPPTSTRMQAAAVTMSILSKVAPGNTGQPGDSKAEDTVLSDSDPDDDFVAVYINLCY